MSRAYQGNYRGLDIYKEEDGQFSIFFAGQELKRGKTMEELKAVIDKDLGKIQGGGTGWNLKTNSNRYGSEHWNAATSVVYDGKQYAVDQQRSDAVRKEKGNDWLAVIYKDGQFVTIDVSRDPKVQDFRNSNSDSAARRIEEKMRGGNWDKMTTKEQQDFILNLSSQMGLSRSEAAELQEEYITE